jgi:hypothetical protein
MYAFPSSNIHYKMRSEILCGDDYNEFCLLGNICDVLDEITASFFTAEGDWSQFFCPDSFKLKIEAVSFSEKSTSFYQTTWCHIPDSL